MVRISRGSDRTTELIHRVIQNSQESLRDLTKRYGINMETVDKRKYRITVSDQKTGLEEPMLQRCSSRSGPSSWTSIGILCCHLMIATTHHSRRSLA